jgi:hypothetical protein
MLLIAGAIVVSMYWEKLKGVIPAPTPKPVDEDKPKPTPEVVDHDHDKDDPSLVDIVYCWENLKDMCEKAGLDKAVDELDKIFPMFVGGEEDE